MFVEKVTEQATMHFVSLVVPAAFVYAEEERREGSHGALELMTAPLTMPVLMLSVANATTGASLSFLRMILMRTGAPIKTVPISADTVTVSPVAGASRSAGVMAE